MKVLLTYRYSDLDKQHQYGLMLIEGGQTQYLWLWFHLGQQIPTFYHERFELLPYSVLNIHSATGKGKIIKEYSQDDTVRLAVLIATKINKHLTLQKPKDK